MKNNKKKVLATVLAISMAISPLQSTAFAEGESTKSFLSSLISQIEPKEQNLSIWQKISKWWTPDVHEKAMESVAQNLRNMLYYENKTGFNWSPSEINQAMKNTYNLSMASNANRGGILSRLLGVVFGQGAFVSMFITLQVVSMVTQYYRNFKTKIEAGKIEKPIDPVAAMQILDMLLPSLKGQEKAKQQIKSIVLNIVDKNAQFMTARNSKRSGPGANVIYMIGPSGVGKTFSADIIRKVLTGFNAEPFVIEASDIDKQSRSSAVDQLFGMRMKRVSNSEVYEYSPLVQRIKAIPNSTVIINEYDKMHTPELDEKLRTIMDQGYINVNGEKIDCSAVTFIVTSNESYGSVNKGNGEVDITANDGTGSRTVVNHDKAFLNRIRRYLIEYDNLSAKEYEEIALVEFSKLAIRYVRDYNIALEFDKNTLYSIAKKVEEQNEGARPVFNFIEKLNKQLLDNIVLQRSLSGNRQPVRYRVSFVDDDFVLENINENLVAEDKFTQ